VDAEGAWWGGRQGGKSPRCVQHCVDKQGMWFSVVTTMTGVPENQPNS
jgi:hypothetical protein